MSEELPDVKLTLDDVSRDHANFSGFSEGLRSTRFQVRLSVTRTWWEENGKPLALETRIFATREES